MRIVGISVVKNEADVIESFVRHNRRFLDALLVVDNGSTDGTREILARLAAEDRGVGVADDPSTDHRQQTILGDLARQLAARGTFDWIVPVDGDEFLRCAGRLALERALARVPQDRCAAIRWLTYVPRPTDDAAERDVLRRVRHRRTREHPRWFKVALPLALARQPGFGIDMGNHGAYTAAGPAPVVELDEVKLAHFPVRSPEQVLTKALTGSWAILQKLNRHRGECFHWHELAARFEREPKVALDEVERVAATWLTGEVSPLVLDPVDVPAAAALRWPELARVDVLARVASYAGTSFRARSNVLFDDGAVALARTAAGPLAFLRDGGEVAHALAHYGEWAPQDLAAALPALAPGDHVVHVGAGAGAHTVPLARAVGPAGRVTAYEADLRAWQLLQGNLGLRGLANVAAAHAAVGDGEGEAPAVRLDDLELAPVKLVKIDLRSRARHALRGARRLLERDRPLVVVRADAPEERKALLLQLASHGYRAAWHVAARFSPANFHERGEDVFGGWEPYVRLVAVHASVAGAPAPLSVAGPDDTWQAALARERSAQALRSTGT